MHGDEFVVEIIGTKYLVKIYLKYDYERLLQRLRKWIYLFESGYSWRNMINFEIIINTAPLKWGFNSNCIFVEMCKKYIWDTQQKYSNEKRQ